MGDFAEETKDMSSVEILNYYRNLYHTEPNTTEQGIVAWAINDILPTYVNQQEMIAKAIDKFASTLIPRLTDAIYQKDVESMTNLINDVARELKAGRIDE